MNFRITVFLAGLTLTWIASVHSASLIAGVRADPHTFLLLHQGSPLATLSMSVEMKNTPPTKVEEGWLRGDSSPGGSYRFASWPIAGPDRFDNFSVRWLGAWEPEEASCEVRLRSDGEATLFLAGGETLVNRGSLAGVTTTLQLPKRPYDLRLDYSHQEGDSWVFLEWRGLGRTWLPLVPNLSGWRGTYFIGAEFQSPRFERADDRIFWNWGDRGPLNRAEDLPTASLTWSDEGDRLLGSLLCNRPGRLSLSLLPYSGSNDIDFEFQKTVLEIAFGTDSSLRFQFDQPGDRIDETGGSRICFEMTAERPIHFWESSDLVRNGGQIAAILKDNCGKHEAERPRLQGYLASMDDPVCGAGRWWVEMLIHRLAFPSPEISSPLIEPSSDAAQDLPRNLLQWAGLFAQDLWGDLNDCLRNSNEQTLRSAFFDSSPIKVDHLLLHFDSPSAEDRNLVSPYPERQLEWRVQSLADGIEEWRKGFQEVQGILGMDQKGAVDFDTFPPSGKEVRMMNVPLDGNEFTFEYSETRFRIVNNSGCFLEFKGPVSVDLFRVNENGEWEARIDSPYPTRVETGPNSQISGATWEGIPILLTGQGDDRKRGFLPGKKGTLRLIPTQKQESLPNF